MLAKEAVNFRKRKGLGLLKSYSGFGLKSETTFTSALDGETFPTIQIETSIQYPALQKHNKVLRTVFKF